MKEIRLENFRCYTELSIPLKSRVNLLVGDNATGKTSVLRACKFVLSAFFSGFSDDNTKWVNPGNEDFMQMETGGILLQERPIHISFDVADVMGKEADSTGGDSFYTLIKKSKKNSRSLTSGLKEYKDWAALLMRDYIDRDGQRIALPLFANFSTEDIHAIRKIDFGKFKEYNHKPSFGYYECLEGDGFFPYWIKRLLVLQEGRENHLEIDIVRKAIQKALGAGGCAIIQDMEVRPIRKKVYYILMDGREVEADFLSDEYRRVDLHLHPTLQSVVLKGLCEAFPGLQFIVSSHAPMVMSGVESNEENIVYKLSYSEEQGYRIMPTVTYGMDMSTLTYVVLGQTPRAVEVDRQLNELFELIDVDRLKEAGDLLRKLRGKYGDSLPELARAEAMLNCLI